MRKLFFYVWWLLADGAVYYLALRFLLDATGMKCAKWHIPVWMTGNAIFVIAAVYFRLPGMFLFDILYLLFFAKVSLAVKWNELAAPLTILFTLYTFLEGFSAILMSWISKNTESAMRGNMIQMMVSVLLDLAFFFCLRLIRKRYLLTMRQPLSSYLYILLMPCALLILAIRYGLRLDSLAFEEFLSSFGMWTSLYALFLMTASVLLFFLMLEVLCRILSLTEKERTAALLRAQVEGQRIYIEEARKRNEQYASFQHDIDNHLLILSGMLREKNFTEAEKYAKKLHTSCARLLPPVSTGNVVLDLLLKEKISYAERNGIEVTCRVQIPAAFYGDDLDLCVIFANIMDNAIHSCMETDEEHTFLSLTTKNRSRFLIIEAVNSSSSTEPIEIGTGLSNIQNIAHKYQGAMEISCDEKQFRITVLLCSPKRKDTFTQPMEPFT